MRSPGGGELSLFACPGVGNRPPSVNKIANPRGCARGGMVTGRIEPCITFHVHLVFSGGLKVPFFVTFCQMSVTSFNTQCKRTLCKFARYKS